MAKKALRAGAMLGPVPAALVSCGDWEEANLITVAWTGILATNPPKTYISVRPTRHSHGLLEKTGEFVLHLTTAQMAKKVDFCGMYTGRKVDKFQKCGFTKEKADTVSVPRVAECPVALECRVSDVLHLGTHDMFLADILSVAVDEALFDKNGKIHMEKAGLCAYVHGEYYALGARLGAFGYSAVKKKKGEGNDGPKKDRSHQ